MSDASEFLAGLTKNDELVKHINNPEAFLLREKARGRAERGEYPNTGCPHPFNAIQQYVDTDPQVKREGKPVNLFECTVCHGLLWLVDPYGREVPDG